MSIFENERTIITKDDLQKSIEFEYRNKKIQIIKFNLTNGGFSFRKDTEDFLLDEFTYEFEILCDGISYNVYDLEFSNRNGMPNLELNDVIQMITEEMENADDLFVFNEEEKNINEVKENV